MDQRTWLWRRRSSEKLSCANYEAQISIKEHEEEKLHHDKEAALESTVKNLQDKVASLLNDCDVKGNLVVEHAKMAQEATEAREKAVAEAAIRKQELEEALKQKAAANERLIHLNAALKDYRKQLNSLKEEQDLRVNEAVEELERAHNRLEEKSAESSRKLANLTVENAQLTKALLMKEDLLEDVGNQMSCATAEFNALISRLDSTEKENDILRYEYCALKRELEVQNHCADLANRQHQESAKNVKKLEAECQNLRSIVKKRVPAAVNNHHGPLDRRMSFMIQRLYEMEEENKILKESVYKREEEIRLLQAEFARMRHDESNVNSVSRRTMIGDSDMSLMDDFVEMEKLAIVSVDAHSYLDSTGKELVPMAMNSSEEDCDWLQSVLNEILEQTHVSKRSFDEILEDIRIALESRFHSVSGYLTWKPPMEEKANEVNFVHKDLEEKLLESEKSIVSLKTELESLKESKRVTEDYLENQKVVNEDLDHQLSVAKFQVNEARQKVSSLQVELEDRSQSCEELEATCLELQLQLASVCDKDMGKEDVEQEKLVQTGWEITAASAKLAECQETIFSLGRQLKALTSSQEAEELTDDQKSNHHSSLRDHIEDLRNSPMTKEIISTTETKKPTKEIISTTETKKPTVVRSGSCNTSHMVNYIVPGKKRGKSVELLRKFLFRRKRGSGGGSKKKMLTIGG